jgi:hypothetical protein
VLAFAPGEIQRQGLRRNRLRLQRFDQEQTRCDFLAG